MTRLSLFAPMVWLVLFFVSTELVIVAVRAGRAWIAWGVVCFLCLIVACARAVANDQPSP